MRTSMINTGRAALAVAALTGLVAGCGGSSSTSSSPTHQAASGGGTRAECLAFTGLLQNGTTALSNHSATQLQAVSDHDAAAAPTFSDPKLKDGAMKLSEYFKQQSDYAKNPTSAKDPDSNLMNAATNDMAVCAP